MNDKKLNKTGKPKNSLKDIVFGIFVLLIPVILIYLLLS